MSDTCRIRYTYRIYASHIKKNKKTNEYSEVIHNMKFSETFQFGFKTILFSKMQITETETVRCHCQVGPVT